MHSSDDKVLRESIQDETVAPVAGPHSEDFAPSTEEIAALAYSFWEARGRRNGSSMDDWLRAESVLVRRSGKDPSPINKLEAAPFCEFPPLP